MRPLIAIVLGLSACAAPLEEGSPEPELELVIEEDFDDAGSLDAFLFTDPAAWTWNPEGSLELLGGSKYEPPHRSPHSIALLKTPALADFVLEVDLLQTGREYGHRDLCLFFAHQEPARFYYVHLASEPDDRAHNVFLVNDAPRTALAAVPERGVRWGEDQWHHVRIERLGESIRVFFDGAEQPIHSVVDDTLESGRIGLGSFDDRGRFDNLRVWSSTPVAHPESR